MITSSTKRTVDNGRSECYMAKFQFFVLMPVLTTRKIDIDYTLIDYDDFEEPPDIDEVF